MSWEERPYSRGSSGKFSDNPLTWAPAIGSLAGIRIRIHILFILFIVGELLRAGPFLDSKIQFLVILWLSVLLHEFGHCFAARRVGGDANEILMWPLGGLAMVSAPMAPWPQFVTVVCGPLVNVALVFVSLILLMLADPRHAELLLAPLSGIILFSGSWFSLEGWLAHIYQTNLYLLLFNLIPMYPMDGGRLLQCALWKFSGYQKATYLTTTIGMVAAMLMGVFALVSQRWLLIGLAVLGYITCYQDRLYLRHRAESGDLFMGYDTAHDTSDLRPRRKGFFARWRERTRKGQWEAQRRSMQALDDEVDRILDKVHREGIQSLSRKEKQLLEQATKQHRRADEEFKL